MPFEKEIKLKNTLNAWDQNVVGKNWAKKFGKGVLPSPIQILTGIVKEASNEVHSVKYSIKHNELKLRDLRQSSN